MQIDIDFMNQNTSSKGNSLFNKWNQFALKIILFMINCIRDENSQVVLQHLLEIQNTKTI